MNESKKAIERLENEELWKRRWKLIKGGLILIAVITALLLLLEKVL